MMSVEISRVECVCPDKHERVVSSPWLEFGNRKKPRGPSILHMFFNRGQRAGACSDGDHKMLGCPAPFNAQMSNNGLGSGPPWPPLQRIW